MMEITRGHEFHGDLEYRYEIIGSNKNHSDHEIKIFEREYSSDDESPNRLIFDGTLGEAMDKYLNEQQRGVA